MQSATRRTFLRKSAAAVGTAAVAAPALATSRLSSNDRIRVGLLGLGGRMRSHVRALVELAAEENVEIAAVCDCDRNKAEHPEKVYSELEGKKLAKYTDMRAMFDDKSIDAVANALGDRWHALSTIWACQAGKDVYVEKPGSHNLFESRQMVAAARKYERMVQHGTQNRSSPNIVEGIEKLKEGVVGELYMARGLDYKLRGNLGRITPSPVPEGLDWDQWLGPKRMVPYSQFWHRRWYWNLELSSGCFANQAVHELDIIRWGLGLDEHPTHVSATGGKYVHEDDRTSPTHVAITYRFGDPKPLVTYEHRSWFTNSEAGFRDQYPFVQINYPVGTIFFGTEGYLIFPDYSSYYTFFGAQCKPGPSKAEEGHPMMDTPHFRNWIQAIRSRNHKELNADIEEGHKSMTLCLLARTSYQVGRCLRFDPATEKVLDDQEADRMLNEPEYREQYVVPKEV
ncbi:MAG TPA: Gfo/Idh/MocA family oxidoreductase [Planctomycetes bacterium]|nr:Gfo/Idh/MocA family oxidoreductase [Planctomycetota bacterium]